MRKVRKLDLDPGAQPERTLFGWERTAIAGLAAGLFLARSAATSQHFGVAVLSVVWVAAAGGLLAWSSVHYTGIHGSIASRATVARPGLVWSVSVGATVLSGLALTLAALDLLQ